MPDHFLAGLTDFQWYFYQTRQTVFYAAFTHRPPTRERLEQMVRDLIAIAPQLAEGFAGIHALGATGRKALAPLITLEEVDDLTPYPQAFDVAGSDIFRQPGLPVFRVAGIVRRSGPDEEGRAGVICITASHALLEGVDSVQFSRSRPRRRDAHRRVPPVSPLRRGAIRALAWLTAPLQLLAATIIASRRIDRSFVTLRVSRARIRAAAEKLGIGQRSLIFALAMFALNDGGRGYSRRKISATYVDLDPGYRDAGADDFFRFRMMAAKFPVKDSFADFARDVDAATKRGSAADTTTQRFLTALFGVHRRLKRRLPFLYPEWIFRFAGFYHLDLSLTPPHQLSGPMTEDLIEPLYCGTFHPGLDVCVFVPNGREITFNFTVRNGLAKHVAVVDGLLDNLLRDDDRRPPQPAAAQNRPARRNRRG